MPETPSSRALALEEWPEELRMHFNDVRGLYVGGCVARGPGSRFRAKAHAHTGGEHQGWLCFLSERRLRDRLLVLHELAHLKAGAVGHTDSWRRVLIEIGGTLDEVPGLLKSYHKKPRTRRAPCGK